MKILAIDDEARALDLFKRNLEVYGFEVLTASDGQVGLVTAKEAKPDLIILDMRMPKLDGWDVCRGLKLNSATEQIPIVFLTAFSNSIDHERAKDYAIKAFLTKPVDMEAMVKVINEIAGEK